MKDRSNAWHVRFENAKLISSSCGEAGQIILLTCSPNTMPATSPWRMPYCCCGTCRTADAVHAVMLMCTYGTAAAAAAAAARLPR